MPSEWLIVLNAGGTVLAVDGGAPAAWIGTRIEERTDAPFDVRVAAADARRQLGQSTTSTSLISRALASTAQPVRVLVLHAVAVRCAPTDVRALLGSTINVMAQQARALEVTLALAVHPDVPQTLNVDSAQLAWAITALVGNALRFVRRGTHLMPGGAIQVRARYDSARSQVALEVQDDGSGIAQDALSRLWHRSPDELHPSGLALSLVQDILAAHGGTLQVESSTAAGRSGTTVRMLLPIH